MSCKYCGTKKAFTVQTEGHIMLNSLLSDLFVLYVKLYNYHWNVTGQNFSELHSLFQGQYETLVGHIDTVAERIRAIRGKPLGTMQEFLAASSLKEGRSEQDWGSMVRELAGDYTSVSAKVSAMFNALTQMGDDGSADMVLAVQAFLDKSAWMLESYS